jgi:RHS repeat-associated protein
MFYHININTCIKKALLVFCLVLMIIEVRAQTYVSSGQMTGTPAAGSYYNNNSITLTQPFSFTAATGSSLSLYITAPDCVPQVSSVTQSQNYIVTSVPRVGNIISAAGLAGLSTCDLMKTVQYLDGLGRPLQTVQVKGSTALKDVVQAVAYDPFGREATKYLPYASPTSDGSYKSAAATELTNFYNPGGNGISGNQQANGIVINPTPFSIINFEPSPLNRETEQGAPGNDWQPVTNSNTGHTVKQIYALNDATALTQGSGRWARLYTATINSNQSRNLVDGGTGYALNQLYVTITQNENWKATSQADSRLNTTEEYKDKEGHVVLKRTYNYTTALQTLSTYYVYDDLGNLAFVLPPAANADAGLSTLANQTTLDNLCFQYGYDERDRLTQKKVPGKGREYTIYNQLDQPVLTQDAVQAGKSPQEWTFTKYDGQGRVIMTGLFKNTATLSVAALQSNIYGLAQYDSKDLSNNTTTYPTGYILSSYPTALSWVFTVNYYDNYLFPGIPYAPTVSNALTKPIGLLTGSKTATLNPDGTYGPQLWSVVYYDSEGRTTQAYRQHYLGGVTALSNSNYDETTFSYNFNDQVTQSTRHHYTAANTAVAIVTVNNSYYYDHVGRKTQTFEQINGGANVLLSQTDYNEIGQLQTKHLHSETGNVPFLQDLSYTYNERGWQRTGGNTANLFNYELRYNSSTDAITNQYNGNIAEMLYKGTNSGSKTFIYSYDALNRLTNAVSTSNALNEQLSYNLNGNIMGLVRSGNSSVNLAYVYQNSNQSNQLQTVTNSGSAFRAYSYDLNGNATSDGGTKTIAYNLLNLPREIGQGSTAIASYTYDVTGNKLRNTGSDGTWDYIDGIVYQNNAIVFINTEEGRAVPNGGIYRYEYNLKDHLGNVRLSFDKNPTTGAVRTIQEDEYYSFGLRKIGGYDLSNNNRYLYSGKEIQTDLTNQYDYGARFYDPVIGRWTSVDPSADEEDQELDTPYGYVANNPIVKNDPDGKIWNFVVGAALGAVVEVGTQMISNHLEHRSLTDINWKAVGVSAVEGAVTSGTSVGEKFLVKAGFAAVKATLDYTKDHDVKSLKDVGNIAKNAAIDMAVDAGGKAVGKLGKAVAGGKIVGAIEKVAEKVGTSRSKVARTLMNAGVNGRVSSAVAKNIRDGQKVLVKGIKESINTTVSSTAKAATNQTVTRVKDNSNYR